MSIYLPTGSRELKLLHIYFLYEVLLFMKHQYCHCANCTFYPQTPADPRHVPRVCVLSRQTAAPPPQLEPEYFL